MAILKTHLLLRNATATQWETKNPVLLKGEAGVEWITAPTESGSEGTCKLKIGDGVTSWKELDYIMGGGSSNISIVGEGNTIIKAEASKPDQYGVVTYTLTRGNRVESIKVTDDNVVIGTPEIATSGAVTIDLKHKTSGITAGRYGPADDVTINGGTGKITIPAITFDTYGHATLGAEKTLTVTIPKESDITITPKDPAGATPATDTVNVIQKISAVGHTITQTGVTLPTQKYVDNKIAAMTNAAVVMRGTLGNGGTITQLPAASKTTLGDAYKVITAGTYNNEESKVGDVFICYSADDVHYQWMRIPSGDDIEDTWRKITCGNWSLGNGITTGELILAAGGGLTVSGDKNTLTYDHKTLTPTSSTSQGNRTYINSLTFDKYGHITSYTTGTESVGDTWRSVLVNGQATKMTGGTNTGAIDFVKGTNTTVSINGNKIAINATDTTYDVVSHAANGLAPKLTTANSFLSRIGEATVPTWNTITALDGGTADTTDWGSLAE